MQNFFCEDHGLGQAETCCVAPLLSLFQTQTSGRYTMTGPRNLCDKIEVASLSECKVCAYPDSVEP